MKLCFLVLIFTSYVHAESLNSSDPLAKAGFYGVTGLWDTPSARVIDDWNVRVGTSVTKPFYYYYGTLGLFDRVEVTGRISAIQGASHALGSDYGRYKDKAVDAKLLLLKESRFFPALAVGATDIHGTGLFTARYIVFSKRLGALDLHWGLGQGIFTGRLAVDIYGGKSRRAERFLVSDETELEPFGGVELFLTKDLSLSAEYTPIKYEKIYGGDEAEWPFTFGFKYGLWDTIYLQGAYARGEELSAGVYLEFPLEAEGPLAWKKEPEPKADEKTLLKAAKADNEELAEILVEALKKDGFGDTKVRLTMTKVWVEFTNSKYISPGLALKRVFLIVDSIAPYRVEEFYLVMVRNNGIFQVGLASPRENLRSLIDSRTDPEGFLEFAYVSHSSKKMWLDFIKEDPRPKDPGAESRLAQARPGEAESKPSRFALSFKPQINTFVNDPSGFLKTRVSLDVRGGYTPWKGGLLAGTYSIPAYNDISTTAEVREKDAARTDIVDYLGREEPHLLSYAFDQVFELPLEGWGRFEAGAFEAGYAGVGGELFRYFMGGRFGIGVEGIISRKRDPDNDFKFLSENKHHFVTYHLNLYARPIPGTGVEVGMRIGQFLAGDRGVRFDVARTFKHFTIGAWLTITDTSHFQSSFNRGYYDKGVYISIPFSVFRNRPVRGKFHYAVSPWTRDPGQMVGQIRRLYPLGRERETALEVERGLWEMRE